MFGGGEDLGFGFGWEVDYFGIVVVFEVEDVVFVLVVFVVIDECVGWVGWECGFVGVGKVEEDSCIVSWVNIGWVVYGYDFFGW